MVDPGTANADQMKAAGLVTSKGKMCADASTKLQLDFMKAFGVPQSLPVPGLANRVDAFCADSRLLQVAGLLSAATLVASS